MDLLTKYLRMRSEAIELKSSDFQEAALKRENGIRVNYALKDYNLNGVRQTMAIVFYPIGKSLGADMAKSINRMFEPVEHLLIVCSKHSKMASHNFTMYWEILLYRELEFDIFENDLMPQYKLLNCQEIKDVAKSWQMTENEFKACIPITLHRKDPVARVMGWKIGNVIKVEEADVLTGCNTFYRLISDDQQF